MNAAWRVPHTNTTLTISSNIGSLIGLPVSHQSNAGTPPTYGVTSTRDSRDSHRRNRHLTRRWRGGRLAARELGIRPPTARCGSTGRGCVRVGTTCLLTASTLVDSQFSQIAYPGSVRRFHMRLPRPFSQLDPRGPSRARASEDASFATSRTSPDNDTERPVPVQRPTTCTTPPRC